MTALFLSLVLTAPVFGPCEQFIYDGTPLDVGTGAAPLPHDWNGDGLTDMLVGTRTLFPPFYGPAGAVVYMPNTGTQQDPLFCTLRNLEADGTPITHSS